MWAMRRELLVSAALVAALAAPAAADVFEDDFDGGIDPAYWSVTEYTESGSGTAVYTADDSQGDIRFAKVGTAGAGMNLIGLTLNVGALARTGDAITGDFAVQVDFSDAVLPGPGLDQVELHTVYADNEIFFNVRDNDNGVDNVHVWTGTLHSGFQTEATSGTLLIRRTGSVIEARLDGQLVHSMTHTAADCARIDFTLQNNLGSNDDTSVTFDNFRLEGADVLPEPSMLLLAAPAALAALRRRRR